MFSRIWTKKSTESYSEGIGRLAEAVKEADAIVIGAGSGLSTSAGFIYSGERFEKYFGDFITKYHIRDMYSGGFYPYPALEEYWAWWSRQIYYNRYVDAPKPVYPALYEMVKDKDHHDPLCSERMRKAPCITAGQSTMQGAQQPPGGGQVQNTTAPSKLQGGNRHGARKCDRSSGGVGADHQGA